MNFGHSHTGSIVVGFDKNGPAQLLEIMAFDRITLVNFAGISHWNTVRPKVVFTKFLIEGQSTAQYPTRTIWHPHPVEVSLKFSIFRGSTMDHDESKIKIELTFRGHQ